MTVTIDGKSYTKEAENGTVTFDIEGLSAGNKTVMVDYSGDDNYLAKGTSENFEIAKNTTADIISVEVEPIDVGETALIKITGPSDIDGMAVVDINGTSYAVEIVNGNGVVEVSGLGEGTYDINVTYLENDKYASSNANTTLNVSKVADTSVSAEVKNSTVDEPVEVVVSLPEDATGTVTITIGNVTKTVPVVGGNNTILVPDVPVGEHDVIITYNGDGKYENKTITDKVTVNPSETAPEDIKVTDLGNGTVIVEVPEGATGTVTVKVDNNTYNATVVNGTAVIDLTDETPGVHDIAVIYSGDENHTAVEFNASAAIPKYESEVAVSVEPGLALETTKVTVSLPENAMGNVTVTIDGKSYTKEAENGTVTFEIEGLSAGNQTVVVDYSGDDNYLANSTSESFHVDKNATGDLISVEVEPIDVGETAIIKITGPSDIDGMAVVDINGTKYAVEIVNGNGVVEVPKLTEGTYDVDVTYLENDKYAQSKANASFEVSKVKDAEIKSEIENTTADQPAVVKVTLPDDATGTVTVTVGNVTRTVPVTGGENEILIPGVPQGEHNVTITYNGDEKYEPQTVADKINVAPAPIPEDFMEIINNDGNTVTINVPEDATGNITVTVDGENYTARIENGTAIVDLSNATPGDHNITLTYSGDDKFPGVSIDRIVSVPKYGTPMSIEVEDGTVGETTSVIVKLPDDTTGTVTVEVDGKNYTAEIKDGEARIEIDGLLSGDKTIVATFDGDINFDSNATTATFKISKIPDAEVDVFTLDVVVGEDAIISVNLPDDATGYVVVNVDGVDYGINITAGQNSVAIPNLASGEHNITATYLGDDKYAESSSNATFDVDKATAEMDVEVENTTTSGSDIIVVLPDDATGTITVDVDGKTITVPAHPGENIIPVSNLTGGENDAVVTYSGDDKYDKEVKNVTIVNDAIATFIVIDNAYECLATDYYAGERGGYIYGILMDENGNLLANKTVQVAVNGPVYDVVTDEHGRIPLQINLMNANVYTYALYFQGDAYYNATHIASSKLTIVKKNTTIKASSQKFKSSLKTKIVKVTLTTVKNPYDGKTYLKAGKKLTLNVNGKTYVGKINGKGVVRFKVKITEVGKYKAKIKFAGDKTYNGSSKTIRITIK